MKGTAEMELKKVKHYWSEALELTVKKASENINSECLLWEF